MHGDLLDLIICAVALSAAVGGFRLGFLARVVSWIGLALGVVVGAKLLPPVINSFRDTDPAGKLLVAALVVLGAAFVGQAIGLVIGARAHRFIPIGPLRTVDDAVGAAVGLLGVLALVWLLIPAMASVAGWPARQTRNSAIARFLDRRFPRPPTLFQTLRVLVGNQAAPEVFNVLNPSLNAGTPPTAVSLPAALVTRVEASTVKVEGEACRRIQDGSGWTVEPHFVITNAHVVAGERHTSVITPSGQVLAATVVAFDPARDLALLAVPSLTEAPLPVYPGSTAVSTQERLTGTTGAVFGHPEGQADIAVTPFLISQYVSALGRDLYDQHDTKRDIFVMASNITFGDSGGAVVSPAGQVVGVAFAIAPDRPGTAYALSYSEVEGFLAAGSAAGPVSTGPCLND